MIALKSVAWFPTFVFAAFLAGSCQPGSATLPAPPAGPTQPGATADPATPPAQDDEDLSQHLKNRHFQELGDALGDGTFLPDMSSFRADPKSALGAVYALKLKQNPSVNSCDSPSADDFELESIELQNAPDSTFPECTPSEFPPHDFEERIVKGGADAKVDALLGEASASSDFAYEFHVSSISAVYPANRTCVDPLRVTSIHLPPRTCTLLYVKGASTTQITFRQYTAITGTVQYNSLITVDGTAYGSSEQMESLLLLTGDFRSLAWFRRAADGFLVDNTQSQAEDVAASIADVAPSAVISDTALAGRDANLLSDLSIQILRDAQPMLPFTAVPPN